VVQSTEANSGINQSKYYGHNFRIEAATTAAEKGMEDLIIKTLERWNSIAYLQYVKIAREQLASYSKSLYLYVVFKVYL